jgi:hypothetical protein
MAESEWILQDKNFFITVYDGQEVHDTGLLCFIRYKPANQAWQNRFTSAWFGLGSFPGGWFEGEDHGWYYSWDGWYKYGHTPVPPYDDFEGYYVQDFVYGWIEPLGSSRRYFFYGEEFHW